MNDFLDNLVTRSLGLAEVVRPRPLSLFEPLQPTGPFAADHFSLDQDGEPSSGVEPIRPASSVPDAQLPEAPPASREPRRVGEDRRKGEDRREGEALAEPPPDPPSPDSVQVARRSASGFAQLLIPHQPMMPAPVAGIAEMRVVSPVTTPADRQVPRETAQVIATDQAAPEHPAAPPEALMPPPPSRTLLVAPAIAPRPGERQSSEIRLSDRAAVPPSSPEAAAQTAPTIKITIGRVDVRAVMPERPASRPVPQRRSPAVSLEEYLKRRSGGKQ
jgi:hypothetical protein